MALQELQTEMEKHMAHLQQLKDYDETLALEREEKARQEQERRKIEVTLKLYWSFTTGLKINIAECITLYRVK